MVRYAASVVIGRSPDDVYAFMDDVSLERRWQPHLLSARQDPPGPSRVGSRKSYTSDFMGRRLENVYRVVELDPARRMVQETEPGSSADTRMEVAWEAIPDGTRVTITVAMHRKGFLRFVPSSTLETTGKKELAAGLDRLKRVLESS